MWPWLIVLILLAAPQRAVADVKASPPPIPLVIGEHERLLVIAPHPDDETLGAGGLIQRVRSHQGTVRVVLVTAGDGYVEAVVHETGLPQPRPSAYVQYGERRLREARAVMRVLDPGGAARLQFLGFPDGGLDNLLRAHWWRDRPERSATTQATDPPYDEAVEPDVPYDGADLRRELVNALRDSKPTIVVLPDPVDKHPDHHATGLFTLLALHDYLASQGKHAVPPRLLAYLVHWPDWPPGWNAASPAAIGSDTPLVLPAGLHHYALTTTSLTLNAKEIATKRAALAKYTSQQEAMPAVLAAFVRQTEPFVVLSPAPPLEIGRWIEHRGRHPLPPQTPREEPSREPK
ncbi:MAG TPA: PIG-L family deacetylase [Candidatus Binatia bacterium]|nr:PIG-L family deacetylase [Candidatus Binatia bacterium]